MTNYRCLECSGTEWEFVINNIVHDNHDMALYQCMKCKRIVATEDICIGYSDEVEYI